jgi:O-antigen/teichoic acid export membrane protein
MKKTQKLLINILVFGIGNIGSKLILFILVPIYTFYLSTTQYGYADLLTTLISLAIPLVSFCIYEAVLRFVLDNKNNHLIVLNTGLMAIFFSSLILLLLGILISYVFQVKYIFIIIFLLVLQMVNIFLTQYIKGLQKNIIYSLNGIILSLLTLVFSLIFFKMDLDKLFSYFFSQLLAYLFSLIYLILCSGLLKNINIKYFNLTLLKRLIIYSLPLIPNQLMWWVMNVSDRFFVTYFIGFSGNGIYAVASKIPSMMNIVSSVFMQAWQISAIEEKNSNEKNIFYSSVFNNLSSILLLIISLIICFLKIIVDNFLSEGYTSVWRYVPFLLLSLLFSNYSMFFGMNYLANMKTTGIFKTSIYGAIVNLILNFLLIPTYGINGASIATMVSFFVVWVIRMRETRQFVQVQVDWKNMVASIIIILFQYYCLYKNIEMLNYTLFVILLIFNIKYLKLWIQIFIYKKRVN